MATSTNLSRQSKTDVVNSEALGSLRRRLYAGGTPFVPVVRLWRILRGACLGRSAGDFVCTRGSIHSTPRRRRRPSRGNRVRVCNRTSEWSLRGAMLTSAPRVATDLPVTVNKSGIPP